MKTKKVLKKLIIILVVLLVLVMGAVIFFDPFYHYHKSLPFLKNILTQRDFQVGGTIDHFDYDAVILGSSVAENINNGQVDDAFGVTCIKAVKASATNADLMYYLERAFEKQDLKLVIYAITTDEMLGDPQTYISETDYYYLLDKNPFNDLEYLLNKDVLLKKIPAQLTYSFLLDYNEDESYSWYATKEFSKEAVTSRYYPQDEFLECRDVPSELSNFYENLDALTSLVEKHSDTKFIFYVSPNSSLWWDNKYRTGDAENQYFYIYNLCETLSEYKNAEIYNFAYNDEYTFNLDIYMDTVHFDEKTNAGIINRIIVKDGIYDKDENKSQEERFRNELIEFSEQEIKEIYPEATTKKGEY